jgi:thiol-disulfide isomerase/thioredoxin
MDETSPAGADRDAIGSSTPWPLWLLVLAAAVVLIVTRMRGGPDDQLLDRPLPPLEVTGWLNAPTPPTAASLRGKVVLIDCWATWCGYCLEEMPDLIDFYHKYHGQGLELIGLTPEVNEEVPQVASYVASMPGLDWPIGYGAMIPLDLMSIEAYPTLILFDRTGRAVWVGYGMSGLEEAVVQALAAE